MHVFFGESKKSWYVGLGEGTASLHDVMFILYLGDWAIKIKTLWAGLVQSEEISAGKSSDKCDGRQPLLEEEPTALLIISDKKRQHRCRCRSVR